MKRRNVQLAFIGEDSTPEGVTDSQRGDEAIDITVTGGSLMVVVPAGTPDEAIYERASVLGGELVLENGMRLSFEINGDAVGARFVASATTAREDHVGLSALPDIPTGA
jgi:hypothetical protein